MSSDAQSGDADLNRSTTQTIRISGLDPSTVDLMESYAPDGTRAEQLRSALDATSDAEARYDDLAAHIRQDTPGFALESDHKDRVWLSREWLVRWLAMQLLWLRQRHEEGGMAREIGERLLERSAAGAHIPLDEVEECADKATPYLLESTDLNLDLDGDSEGGNNG